MRTLLAAIGLLTLGPVGRADDAKAEAEAGLGKWRQVALVTDGMDCPSARRPC